MWKKQTSSYSFLLSAWRIIDLEVERNPNLIIVITSTKTTKLQLINTYLLLKDIPLCQMYNDLVNVNTYK